MAEPWIHRKTRHATDGLQGKNVETLENYSVNVLYVMRMIYAVKQIL